MKYFKNVFQIFQSKEAHYESISQKESYRLIIKQIIVICVFAFLYGLVMGSYHGVLQSVVAGIKVVVLFLSTLLICFPSFFIVQLILGSRMNVNQTIRIVLSGFVLASTITISFAPIVIFFLITGSNYYFLQLLHVSVFIFSGIFGMKLIIESLKYACEEKNIYPKTGVTVFKVWIVILAFVGIQLAWNLRPFLSDKGEEFKLFRKYEGNFYTAIVYSVRQLVTKEPVESEGNNTGVQHPDSLTFELDDSTDLFKIIEN